LKDFHRSELLLLMEKIRSGRTGEVSVDAEESPLPEGRVSVAVAI
jgi:hypothetical protein